MQPFTHIENAIAATLPLVNIDTDMIIPKQYLKTIKRTGLGVHLFDEMRYDEHGNEHADFVLNQEPYRHASVLIADENFGCGSSREHAPWALLDFGIRVIIAPSFADIFFNNCFKNGILPIVLEKNKVKELMALSSEERISVDLEKQCVTTPKARYSFDVEAFRKKCLMEGLDDIAMTLQKEDAIKAFEKEYLKSCAWL